MSVFSGSSRGRGGIESDGTHAVICWLCRETITRTTLPVSRALCVLCEASEKGQELTEAAITSYKASRAVMNGVSLFVLEEPPPVLPGVKKFVLGTVGEGISRAVGFLRRKPDEEAASAKIAKSRRRTPLLRDLGMDDSIGSMDDVDALLKQKREES